MTGSQLSSVTVGATTTFIVGGSYARRALIFHPPANNRVTLSNDATVVLDMGPTLQQGQAPLVLTMEQHGDVVQMPWNGISNLAGTVIGVTEVFGPWPLQDDSAGPVDTTIKPNFPNYPRIHYGS